MSMRWVIISICRAIAILAGRAMGQESIDAEVNVWDVVGPLPSEEAVALGRPLPTGNLAEAFETYFGWEVSYHRG